MQPQGQSYLNTAICRKPSAVTHSYKIQNPSRAHSRPESSVSMSAIEAT